VDLSGVTFATIGSFGYIYDNFRCNPLNQIRNGSKGHNLLKTKPAFIIENIITITLFEGIVPGGLF